MCVLLHQVGHAMYQARQLLAVSQVMLSRPIHLQDPHDMYQLMLPVLQQVITDKLLSGNAVVT